MLQLEDPVVWPQPLRKVVRFARAERPPSFSSVGRRRRSTDQAVHRLESRHDASLAWFDLMMAAWMVYWGPEKSVESNQI
jgi:hypothetical protein